MLAWLAVPPAPMFRCAMRGGRSAHRCPYVAGSIVESRRLCSQEVLATCETHAECAHASWCCGPLLPGAPHPTTLPANRAGASPRGSRDYVRGNTVWSWEFGFGVRRLNG